MCVNTSKIKVVAVYAENRW